MSIAQIGYDMGFNLPIAVVALVIAEIGCIRPNWSGDVIGRRYQTRCHKGRFCHGRAKQQCSSGWVTSPVERTAHAVELTG
jgi:hypothetical protein